MDNKLIIISAMWCPSCLILKKNLKKLKDIYNIDYIIYDYDLDEEEVNKYNIGDKLPVIIYNKSRLIGEKSFEELENFIKERGII